MINTKTVDFIFQEAYLANILVNSKKIPQTFYEMDLLFQYHNGKFKQFQANKNSYLQENNEIFQLYA